MDRRVRRSTDTEQSFLRYAAPLVQQTLLAAPARGLEIEAAFAAHAEKHVASSARRGFRQPSDALFPPCVALAPGLSLEEAAVQEVLTELSAREEGVVMLDPATTEARADGIAQRLGSERVRRGSCEPDPFSTVTLQATGHLSVGGASVDCRRSSVEGFWLSPQVRRVRALALNGEAA